MRTIIDIPKDQVAMLDQVSRKKNTSRAAIIRQAIANYITIQRSDSNSFINTFGIWKDKKIDSVEYQQKLRKEWDNASSI